MTWYLIKNTLLEELYYLCPLCIAMVICQLFYFFLQNQCCHFGWRCLPIITLIKLHFYLNNTCPALLHISTFYLYLIITALHLYSFLALVSVQSICICVIILNKYNLHCISLGILQVESQWQSSFIHGPVKLADQYIFSGEAWPPAPHSLFLDIPKGFHSSGKHPPIAQHSSLVVGECVLQWWFHKMNAHEGYGVGECQLHNHLRKQVVLQ